MIHDPPADCKLTSCQIKSFNRIEFSRLELEFGRAVVGKISTDSNIGSFINAAPHTAQGTAFEHVSIRFGTKPSCIQLWKNSGGKMNASEEHDVESEGSFSDFMSDVEGQVIDLIKKTNKAPSDAYESWNAFSSAIEWKETWIICLLSFHIFLFLLIVLTRKRFGVQTCIFFFISVLVRLAERINLYCSNHWQEFSSQNYFDKNGLFAGILFSGPLLLMCLLMLVS